MTQVRLDLHEAHIRKQERDLHTDTTSHPQPRLTPQLRSGRTGACQNSVYYRIFSNIISTLLQFQRAKKSDAD
jgi:hypothetical protein